MRGVSRRLFSHLDNRPNFSGERRMFKARVTLAIALLAMLLTTVGCNTMEGAGEDLSAAGRGIERSADREKDY
jgi:predicted small secreted protein